jgi:hypothetical protein
VRSAEIGSIVGWISEAQAHPTGLGRKPILDTGTESFAGDAAELANLVALCAFDCQPTI